MPNSGSAASILIVVPRSIHLDATDDRAVPATNDTGKYRRTTIPPISKIRPDSAGVSMPFRDLAERPRAAAAAPIIRMQTMAVRDPVLQSTTAVKNAAASQNLRWREVENDNTQVIIAAIPK